MRLTINMLRRQAAKKRNDVNNKNFMLSIKLKLYREAKIAYEGIYPSYMQGVYEERLSNNWLK